MDARIVDIGAYDNVCNSCAVKLPEMMQLSVVFIRQPLLLLLRLLTLGVLYNPRPLQLMV